MSDKQNLFKEFPPISEEQWLEKVAKDLKGRAIEELDWNISDNINVAPFYHSIDQEPLVPNNKKNSNTWEIGEDILLSNPNLANQQLLQALEAGVNAPRIVLDADWNEQARDCF